VAPSTDDLPEQRLLAGELNDRVRAAVATLPQAQQQVVMLRDIQGFSSEEVCGLLHRGRSKVRAAVEAYCAAP
jgi:RNA polymerase sigma-70 factor, ECF subfamily